MRNILIIIFLLSSLLTQAQTEQQRNFGIAEVFRSGDSIFIKKLVTQVVNVSEGTVTKFRTPPDTAKLFIAPDGGIYEGVITWKKVGGGTPNPPVIEKIDGELATFTGTWARTSNNPAWYMSTIAYSNTVGAAASYTFTGTKIELWGERLASHGTGTITLAGFTTQANFKAEPFGLPVKIYESPVLPIGTYTLRLTVGSGYNLLDYFLVTK